MIDLNNENALPAVLEIPSKDHPYNPAKDSVLRRAKVIIYHLRIYWKKGSLSIFLTNTCCLGLP